jgi:hypothetical protein
MLFFKSWIKIKESLSEIEKSLIDSRESEISFTNNSERALIK